MRSNTSRQTADHGRAWQNNGGNVEEEGRLRQNWLNSDRMAADKRQPIRMNFSRSVAEFRQNNGRSCFGMSYVRPTVRDGHRRSRPIKPPTDGRYTTSTPSLHRLYTPSRTCLCRARTRENRRKAPVDTRRPTLPRLGWSLLDECASAARLERADSG